MVAWGIWREYGFWLAAVSLVCLIAERVIPWRKEQALRRPQWLQDVGWFILNGYFLHHLLRPVMGPIEKGLSVGAERLTPVSVDRLQAISDLALGYQILIALVLLDFVEWCVHNLLHRTNWLWRFHRIHHSITTMDWIGNFRFHWGEVILYQSIKYLPLAALGARWEALLIVAVLATVVGHLNHSNLRISWGPLRYFLNSPRMHIWHHDKSPRKRAGENFGVVLSVWDWAFGTAYMPLDKVPDALGFRGEERSPQRFFRRFFLPFLDVRAKA